MKKYTILQALKEIQMLFPFDLSKITSIEFEDGSGNKFILKFGKNIFFVNLDNQTYKAL